jgi:hypothetical protein
MFVFSGFIWLLYVYVVWDPKKTWARRSPTKTTKWGSLQQAMFGYQRVYSIWISLWILCMLQTKRKFAGQLSALAVKKIDFYWLISTFI